MGDTRYLEDIKSDNDQNFKDVIDKCKPFDFLSLKLARDMRLHCMNRGMELLGFDPMSIMNMCTTAEMAEETIDQMMVKHKIVIENWADKECEPERRGLYMYKAGELAYFISMIKASEGPDKQTFQLVTNIKFD